MKSRSALPPTFALLALASALPAQGATWKQLREMLPTDWSKNGLVLLEDFDGDGDLDLFTGGGSVYGGAGRVYRFDPAAGYQEVFDAFGLLQGAEGLDVASGDLNGDGLPDILKLGGVFGGSVLLGDGTCKFTYLEGALPSGGSGLDLADLDNDGDLDAVIADSEPFLDTDYVVFSNLGSGSFGKLNLDDGPAMDVDLGDVNADGLVDALFERGPSLYFGNGALGFTEVPGVFPNDAVPHKSLLEDLDGDGDLDVFATYSLSDALIPNLVFENDGSGAFLPGPPLPVLPDELSEDLIALDLDGDLDLDVLHAAQLVDGGTGVLWYENQGGLVFDESPQPWPAGAVPNPLGLAGGDIDQDGDADLVVGMGVGSPAALLLQADDGAFADVSGPWLRFPSVFQVALDDFTGDGYPDAVVMTGQDELALLTNDGAGGLAPAAPGALPQPTDGIQGLVPGDLDHDGDADFVVLRWENPELVYVNDGSGSFTTNDTVFEVVDGLFGPSFELSQELALGDLEGDGDLDAVLVNLKNEDVVFQNQGGLFLGASLFTEPENSEQVALGDLDLDGDLDAYVGRWNASRDAWYVNDGSGGLSLGTEFPRQSWREVKLVDIEDDGDLDVFAVGDELHLLRNDGPPAFTDLSQTLPELSSALNPVELLPVDVEGDGDVDLIAPSGGDIRTFLNDGGGAFTIDTSLLAYPSELLGPDLALADMDLDGDPDVVLGDWSIVTTLTNVTTQIARRATPRLGKPFGLDLYGAPSEPWVLAYAPGFATVDLGPLGILKLNPAQVLVIAGGSLDGNGRAGLTFQVPDDTSLIGVTVGVQAAIGNPLALSNLERLEFTSL